MYPKNAASPEPIAIGAVVQISDGAVQTSGCTVRIKPIGVAEGDGAGTTAYSTDGIVLYTPTQAETNYTSFILIAKKTGCIPVAITVVTSASTTAGYAGTDQSKIANPTSTVALTGTTIATTQKVDIETIKTNPVVNAGTITFPTGATLASTTNITAGTITTATNVTTVNGLAAGVITAASIAADAITDAKVAADVTIASVTGSVGSVTGNVGGNVTGSVGSIATGGIAASSFAAGAIDAAAIAASALNGKGDWLLSSSTGNGFTAIPWNAAWDAEVQSEVDDALVAIHLDHLLAADYDPAAKPGVATALLNELVESDAGVSRYTANALEQAPTGGSAPTVSQIATAVWQDATAGDFTVAGSIGKSLFTSGAVPGAAGGLFIAGSNAATTFATLTVTGATTLTGAVSMAAGLAVTNSGGHAVSLVSSDVFSHGLYLEGGAAGTSLTTQGTVALASFFVTNNTTFTGQVVAINANNDIAGIDVKKISGDATAANNAESFFDGTGYAGTNNVIPTVTTLTGHTPQTGDSYAIVNSGTHGNSALKTLIDTLDNFVDTEVASIKTKTDQLTFTVANQVDANALTGGGGLDAAGVRAAVGLASANLDSQLATIDNFLDTEIASILAIATKLDTALELDGAVYRFTTNALEQAPTGGGTPQTGDSYAYLISNLGTAGAALTKIRKYLQLLSRKDAAIATDNAAELTEINANGGSGAGSFDNQTDSEQAIRDRGDIAWGSAGGGGSKTV